MAQSGMQYEIPKHPRGLVVFLHGANQDVGWSRPRDGGHKHVFWHAALDADRACLALKSPGNAWNASDPIGRDDGDYVRTVVSWWRDFHLLTQAHATVYIGFSSGTGPASIAAFTDPQGAGLVMMGACGRIESARSPRESLLPVFIGFGGRDARKNPGQFESRIKDWRDKAHGARVADLRLPRIGHRVDQGYLEPAFQHVGIPV